MIMPDQRDTERYMKNTKGNPMPTTKILSAEEYTKYRDGFAVMGEHFSVRVESQKERDQQIWDLCKQECAKVVKGEGLILIDKSTAVKANAIQSSTGRIRPCDGRPAVQH